MSDGILEFKRALVRGAEAMHLPITDTAVELMARHWLELDRWADRMNLTTVRDPQGAAERLFLDSAVVAHRLSAAGTVVDVGSGGGFPGLVIKALLGDRSVVLIEARRKKVSFLRQAARSMGLSAGIQVIQSRLEEGGAFASLGLDIDRGAVSDWVSRATFPPAIWMGMAKTLLAPGANLWVFAGSDHDGAGGEGGQGASEAWSDSPGLAVERALQYQLPFSKLNRVLLRVQACQE